MSKNKAAKEACAKHSSVDQKTLSICVVVLILSVLIGGFFGYYAFLDFYLAFLTVAYPRSTRISDDGSSRPAMSPHLAAKKTVTNHRCLTCVSNTTCSDCHGPVGTKVSECAWNECSESDLNSREASRKLLQGNVDRGKATSFEPLLEALCCTKGEPFQRQFWGRAPLLLHAEVGKGWLT